MDDMNNDQVPQQPEQQPVQPVQQPVQPQQPVYQQPPQQPVYQQQPVFQQMVASPSQGMAIASLVLGVVSIVFCWFWPIALFAAIIGVVLGFLARSKAKQMGMPPGMAMAGMVLSIVGLALTVLIIAAVAACACGVSNELDELNDLLNDLENLY